MISQNKKDIYVATFDSFSHLATNSLLVFYCSGKIYWIRTWTEIFVSYPRKKFASYPPLRRVFDLGFVLTESLIGFYDTCLTKRAWFFRRYIALSFLAVDTTETQII